MFRFWEWGLGLWDRSTFLMMSLRLAGLMSYSLKPLKGRHIGDLSSIELIKGVLGV